MDLSKLGRYELVTRIGQGGMAEVQLAVQRGPAGFEKLVVIKLIHEKLAKQKTFVDMLLEEARIAALVKHPNVVDIYDLGIVEGRYFIAMEYLEGEPLLALLRAGREGPRLDTLSTVRLIADTAEGLDAAHELRSLAGDPLGLVHHDVSLGNIVVLYNGQVKLVDFGVARATAAAGPSLKVHGKISYMAPEKLRGQPGDRRSDIWSLGVVLWEALTLRRLFRGNDERETMHLVLDHPIPLPSQVNSDVPQDVDAIVMRALERDPDRRYATAKELSEDLEALLAMHSYGRQNRIAAYMQATFGSHIVARRNLMREVSTRGTASAAVLEAAFFADEKHSIPGEVSIRFKRKTADTPTPGVRATQRRSIVTEVPVAEGTPIQSVDDVIDRPRRNSFRMVAEGTPHSQVTPLPIGTGMDNIEVPSQVEMRIPDRPDTNVDPHEPAIIRDIPPLDTQPIELPLEQQFDAATVVEESTRQVDPGMLDALVTRSAVMDTPDIEQEIDAEVERSISEVHTVPPVPDVDIDVEDDLVTAPAELVQPITPSKVRTIVLAVILAFVAGFAAMLSTQYF